MYLHFFVYFDLHQKLLAAGRKKINKKTFNKLVHSSIIQDWLLTWDELSILESSLLPVKRTLVYLH